MAQEDDSKLFIDQFNGLYVRGLPDDCPKDHARDCRNLVFSSSGQIATRPGLTSSLTLTHSGGKVRRFFKSPYGLLVLDHDGNIFVDGGAAPLFSLALMSDFAALTMFGKVFLSPNDGAGGFYTSFLQMWNGTTLRKAAGFAPTWATLSAVDGTAGKVDKGVHKFMVAYITDTGFITPPGPKEGDHNIEEITTGATTTLKMTGHGLTTGDKRTFTGGIDKWAPLNGEWEVTVTDVNHVTIPLNSTGFGAMVGRPVMDGLTNPLTFTAAGDKKVNLSGIPTGG